MPNFGALICTIYVHFGAIAAFLGSFACFWRYNLKYDLYLLSNFQQNGGPHYAKTRRNPRTNPAYC